jgi:hypothetical protein
MNRQRSLSTSVLILALLCAFAFETPGQELRWYRGNTHTHTTNSDGDSAPADVVDWYKKNGYNFLVITDHEHITAIDELNAKFGESGKFLVMQGQEITDRFDTKPYHVNALGLGSVIRPQRGTTIVSNVQKNVDAVRAAGAIPQINHPNFGWALTADDVLQVNGAPLMEIYSGHPLVNMAGGGGVPSVEQLWDTVLTRGKIIYGVAVDDVHHLKRLGDRTAATPGHGWIMVRAAELSSTAILAALDRGDFYASSGVELEDYSVTPREIRVKIREARGRKYTTLFIGAGGKVLQRSIGLESAYKRTGREKYVRVKVIDSNGYMLWTQPVFSARPAQKRSE